MKKYIKPQIDITLVTTSPLLIGSGGTWDPGTQTQEGKETEVPVNSTTTSSSVWGEEE